MYLIEHVVTLHKKGLMVMICPGKNEPGTGEQQISAG
jgi:hypothetical protein